MRTTDRHLTSSAHRTRQRQVLEKSIQSLDQDPIDERNHTAMTLAIDPAKLPQAKRRIERFMEDMTQYLESGARERVYEMTIGLIPLQRKPKSSGESK